MSDDISYVRVNGVSLAYQTHAAAANLPPLVFVHGYGMRSTGPLYAGLLGRLSARYTVHALDLRGHGGSVEATANWSLDAWADDVPAVLDALGIAGAVYVGHSIGGFTGLNAAIRHPGAVSALCLLTTAAASGGGSTPAELGEMFAVSGRDREVMRGAFAPMYLRPTPAILDLTVESIALIPPEIHRAFFSTFPDRSLVARLGEIQSPVLVLNGLADVVVPPQEQHATAIGLPHVKEINISGQGHMLPIEAPDLTAREIIGFCDADLGLWPIH